MGANASDQFVTYEEVIDLGILATCNKRSALSMWEVDEFIEIRLMDLDSGFFEDEIVIRRAKLFNDGIE